MDLGTVFLSSGESRQDLRGWQNFQPSVINRVEWWWRDHTMKVVLEILVRAALK